MAYQGKKRLGEKVAQGFGVFCVAVVLSAVWPGWDAVWKMLTHEATPAWVQAFGSIGAIASGFAVANFQLNRQRIENLAAERARGRASLVSSLDHLYSMLDMCGRHLNIVIAHAKDSEALTAPDCEILVKSMKSVVYGLDQIPSARSPGGGAIFIVGSLKVALDPVVHNLEAAVDEIRGLEKLAGNELENPLVLKSSGRSEILQCAQFAQRLVRTGQQWAREYIETISPSEELNEARYQENRATELFEGVLARAVREHSESEKV